MSKKFTFTGSYLKNAIVQDGLILHYDTSNALCYSGSGSTMSDLSSSGYDATLVNSPTYSTDNGGVIIYDGVDQYADVDSGLTLSMSNPFTIQFIGRVELLASEIQSYMKIKTDQTEPFMIFPSELGGYQGLCVGVQTGARLRTNEFLTKGDYYFLTVTYNGSGYTTMSNYTLSVNDVLKTNVATGGYEIGSGNVTQVARMSNFFKTLDGTLPVLAIYDRVLTSEEQTANFDALKDNYSI